MKSDPTLNRLANVGNPYQGSYKKVLCICSAGLLRCPTAAFVLSKEPFNFNTRSAGISEEYALIFADTALILWADEIVVMSDEQEERIVKLMKRLHPLYASKVSRPIFNLEIPDKFAYRDDTLQALIKSNYLLKAKLAEPPPPAPVKVPRAKKEKEAH